MARQEQQQQQLLAEQTQSRIRQALDAGVENDPDPPHLNDEPLRRNSNPNLKTTFADNSTVASSDSNSSSLQPPPMQMHPSMAFARPSTSQASMQSIQVDPNNAEQLREEVKRLQLAMIDQFRGNNKNR